MKLNSVLLKSTVVASLGGLPFGFDTAVISGTTGALSQVYGLSSKSLGITVSIAIWGTVVGAMLAGIPGERYGRRDSLSILLLRDRVDALRDLFFRQAQYFLNVGKCSSWIVVVAHQPVIIVAAGGDLVDDGTRSFHNDAAVVESAADFLSALLQGAIEAENLQVRRALPRVGPVPYRFGSENPAGALHYA